MQGRSLLLAVKAFCQAPGNPAAGEKLELARRDDGIEAWLAEWPPEWKDFAGDAWQAMKQAIHAEGDLRRAHAAVLGAYVARLEGARNAALRPIPSHKAGKRPPSEPPPGARWMKD